MATRILAWHTVSEFKFVTIYKNLITKKTNMPIYKNFKKSSENLVFMQLLIVLSQQWIDPLLTNTHNVCF